ncbi:hypothetical protein FB451DRAFT_1562675 [Mycena latifolia]|nr:hypothetical protein FB451DRAFT_1562675 [Mycena latifolia]
MSAAAFRRRLAELDAEIIELKTALDVLQRCRMAVQNQLHATSTFPVLTLPIEITAEIFSRCLPSIEELRTDDRSVFWKSRCQAPTVFLGVCRTWRDIALGTPALWAMLVLRFDFVADEVVAKPMAVEEFIDIWLGRAALHPLSIVFRTIDAASAFTPSRMRDVIHRHAHRVKYIELEMSQCYVRQLGLDLVAFPLLERAVLDDPFDPDPDSSNPVEIYRNAPQLRDLILLDDTVLSFYTPPSLQLTTFEGEIDNLDLFMMAPNLVEAKCTMDEWVPIPTSPILHPCLQSLTLSRSYFGVETFDIFLHLTLPSLQFLHISDSNIEDVTDSLSDFLARSSPPLRTLCARVKHGTFPDWNSCFSCVAATLENLELRSPNSKFQRDVFNLGLGPKYSRYDPLPQLRTLHFVNAVVTDYTALFDFLHTRSTTPTLAKLRSFRLTSRPGTFFQDAFSDEVGTGHDKTIGHLAQLASQGIDIHIGTTKKTYLKHVHYIPGDPAYEFVS